MKKKIIITSLVVGTILLIYYYRKSIKNKADMIFKDSDWYKTAKQVYKGYTTKSVVDKLHPKFKQIVIELIVRVEKETDYYIVATSGLRTAKEQADLKAQNHKNATLSLHNFGFAIDFGAINKKDGTWIVKSSPKEVWLKSGIVKIAKELGFKWGGDFPNYYDPVHFEKSPFGLMASALKTKYLDKGKVDDNGYILV